MSDSDGDFSDELLELAGAGEKKRKKSSSRAHIAKRWKADVQQSESEQEYESEEDDSNPYPLEGKFMDEADREQLMQLPEIERESILSQRGDEMQRFLDKRNLDQMVRAQRGDAENVSKAAKRTHLARGSTKEKTRKLDELKAKRKAKSERKRTKASSPKRERSSSPMDMEMSSEDEEDGQITKHDQEEERESRLLNKAKPVEDEEVTLADIERCRLMRDNLIKYVGMPWFDEYAKGSWVRYLIGAEQGHNVYRLCEIISTDSKQTKTYKIEGQQYNTTIELKHGSAVKSWPLDRVSNSPTTEDEWARLKKTCEAENIKLPTKRVLEKKIQQHVKLPDQVLTDADIDAMVARKVELNRKGTSSRMLAYERADLVQRRELAKRRRDFAESAQLDAQIAVLDEAYVPRQEEKEDILAKVNERNRQANREAVRRAETAEAERKRKARMARAAANESRPGTPGNLKANTTNGTPNTGATLSVVDVDSKRSISPLPAVRGPLGKRTLESIVANSIEIDLGDF